jgi:phosphoesterase RecJ-like protein
MIAWKRFCEIVQQSRCILLTSHIRPDCDALGSELGMAEVLEALGKQVVIVNGDTTPPNLAFIDPKKRLKTLDKDLAAADLPAADLLMILDTSAWAQLGPMGKVVREFTGTKIILDHHVGEDDLGAIAFKDIHSEATGRLVVEAADQLEVRLTNAMATPLFAALATDTGWFRFPSVTELTFTVAARLRSAGARPHEIFASLYEQETLGRLRLRGLILSRLETELQGRLIHTYVRGQDFAAAGAIPPDTEDAINLSLSVAGTEFAVIVVEQLQGGCKISFRSRCAVDCSQIAKTFGGGGHRAAAGAFIAQPLEIARQQVLEAVRKALESPP